MAEFNPREYWDNRLSREYSLKGVGDIGLSVSYNKFLYRVRASAFRYVMKYVPVLKKTSVLDIGSGTGFYIEQWRKQGVRYILGSDITDTAVFKLNHYYPDHEFFKQDIGGQLTEELKNSSFDVVTAFDVLFHIIDDNNYELAIKNFSQLVKKDGYLIFSDNLSPIQKILLEHQVSRTEREVFSLMKKNGFVPIISIPMFVFMNDPVRTKNRFLIKLFSKLYKIASKGEIYGRIVGAFLYPMEVLCIRIMRRGPSTEIFVWRRV